MTTTAISTSPEGTLMNADHIATILEEHASVEGGRLANIPYLAVKLAEMADREIDALNRIAEETYARLRSERDEALKNPPKHDYWMAGEPDCPKEIKAGNGELHTLRCRRCGLDSPRSQVCAAE